MKKTIKDVGTIVLYGVAYGASYCAAFYGTLKIGTVLRDKYSEYKSKKK